MSELLSVWELTVEDIRAVVRRSVHPRLDIDQIADFIASVDWSGATPDRMPPIQRHLGPLEGITAQFQDGWIPEDEYVEYLLSLLPEDERARLAAARRD